MNYIVIAEDEARIASFVSKGLEAAGYATTAVGTAGAAYDLLVSADVDLLVLDIGLPDEDGLSLLSRVRGQGINVPVIVLTARASISDTVAALEGGADDYMAKPFQFEELLARIRLRLREAGDERTAATLRAGGLELDLHTRRAIVDGRSVDLSAREFSLLEVFLSHPGHVLSREQLLARVWGYDFDPGSNVVDVYVRYLRNKLGSSRIQTMRGMGYRLAAAPRDDPGPALVADVQSEDAAD